MIYTLFLFIFYRHSCDYFGFNVCYIQDTLISVGTNTIKMYLFCQNMCKPIILYFTQHLKNNRFSAKLDYQQVLK